MTNLPPVRGGVLKTVAERIAIFPILAFGTAAASVRATDSGEPARGCAVFELALPAFRCAVWGVSTRKDATHQCICTSRCAHTGTTDHLWARVAHLPIVHAEATMKAQNMEEK